LLPFRIEYCASGYETCRAISEAFKAKRTNIA